MFVRGCWLATLAAAVLPFVPDGGLRELYDRTIGYQAGRPSPFGIWGQVELDWLQTTVKAAAVALALAVAIVPRRPSPRQTAALGAAVLIALELAVTHWFYLYVVWFAPFVLVTVLAAYRDGDAATATMPATGAARAEAGAPARRCRLEARRGARARPARGRLGADVPRGALVGRADQRPRRLSRYAAGMLAGGLPYRDFFFEYPPLSAPLLALPGIPGTDYETYRGRSRWRLS